MQRSAGSESAFPQPFEQNGRNRACVFVLVWIREGFTGFSARGIASITTSEMATGSAEFPQGHPIRPAQDIKPFFPSGGGIASIKQEFRADTGSLAFSKAHVQAISRKIKPRAAADRKGGRADRDKIVRCSR